MIEMLAAPAANLNCPPARADKGRGELLPWRTGIKGSTLVIDLWSGKMVIELHCISFQNGLTINM